MNLKAPLAGLSAAFAGQKHRERGRVDVDERARVEHDDLIRSGTDGDSQSCQRRLGFAQGEKCRQGQHVQALVAAALFFSASLEINPSIPETPISCAKLLRY